MRSLEKRKKGMGYENACLATEGRGTHFHIPCLSYVFPVNASVVPYKASPGPSLDPLDPPRDPKGGPEPPPRAPGAFLAAVASIFVSATFTQSKDRQFNIYIPLLCTMYYILYIVHTYNTASAAQR